MDLNAVIIDSRVSGLMQQLREDAESELGISDEGRLRSVSFVHLCVATMLDLDDEGAFDCIVTRLEGNANRDFERAMEGVTQESDRFFAESIADISAALKELYGERTVSLQQLAATYRRADLIDFLDRAGATRRPPRTAAPPEGGR